MQCRKRVVEEFGKALVGRDRDHQQADRSDDREQGDRRVPHPVQQAVAGQVRGGQETRKALP
jgi:hypothetical protein